VLAGLLVSESVDDGSEEFVGMPASADDGVIATMTSTGNTPIKIFETYSDMEQYSPDTTPMLGIVLETSQIVEWRAN